MDESDRTLKREAFDLLNQFSPAFNCLLAA